MFYGIIILLIFNLILLLFVISQQNRISALEERLDNFNPQVVVAPEQPKPELIDLDKAAKQFEQILNETPKEDVDKWLKEDEVKPEQPKPLPNLNKGYGKQY